MLWLILPTTNNYTSTVLQADREEMLVGLIFFILALSDNTPFAGTNCIYFFILLHVCPTDSTLCLEHEKTTETCRNPDANGREHGPRQHDDASGVTIANAASLVGAPMQVLVDANTGLRI
jgi:hypothetical protein